MQQTNREKKSADIVIADDSPVQLEALRYELEKNGHRVRSGINGMEALEHVRSSPPDLIISDVIMPIMNGYEFCREIRKNPAYERIPVILLTALTDTQDVALALESGADSFITKPFNSEYLQVRIRQILSIEHKLRALDTGKNPFAVSFDGTMYHIASGREQMFEFLLTAYEVAIMKQREVIHTEEKLRKTNENLSDLNRIISICNSALPAKEMFELLVQTIVEVLDFEFGAIYLFDDDRTSVRLQCYYELIPAYNAFMDLLGSLDPKVSPNAEALVNGECGFFDLTLDPPHLEREKIIFEAMGAKAYVLLPVKAADQILGTIVLVSTTEHSFADKETGLLESVGREVGSAVKRLLLQHRIEAANEEMNQYLQILRQANKKLNLLSGITRHDINNQLTVLMGFLLLMENKRPDPVMDEYYPKVTNAARRISAMIQFTKEYEEIGVHAPLWQDCSTLVDTAIKQITLGKISVNNEIPAGTELLADPLVIKVFYNLMDNAVRYGGKITTIRFLVKDCNGAHLLVCEDDGDGIPTDEKEKIFERGYGKNTGLGLALSREILDITGTTITETGEPGSGARFEMTVPEKMWRIVGKDK